MQKKSHFRKVTGESLALRIFLLEAMELLRLWKNQRAATMRDTFSTHQLRKHFFWTISLLSRALVTLKKERTHSLSSSSMTLLLQAQLFPLVPRYISVSRLRLSCLPQSAQRPLPPLARQHPLSQLLPSFAVGIMTLRSTLSLIFASWPERCVPTLMGTQPLGTTPPPHAMSAVVRSRNFSFKIEFPSERCWQIKAPFPFLGVSMQEEGRKANAKFRFKLIEIRVQGSLFFGHLHFQLCSLPLSSTLSLSSFTFWCIMDTDMEDVLGQIQMVDEELIHTPLKWISLLFSPSYLVPHDFLLSISCKVTCAWNYSLEQAQTCFTFFFICSNASNFSMVRFLACFGSNPWNFFCITE